MEKITEEMKRNLDEPLSSEAISQHPTKTYLSSIKAIYVTERLNDVFWVGSWTVKTDFIENAWSWMIVVKVTLEIPEYGVYYESFWWNDNWWEGNKNFDLGDAYKWATTDAITKICSYMWIGANVFKWKSKWKATSKQDIMDFINRVKEEKDVNHLDTIYKEFTQLKWSQKQTDWFIKECKEKKEQLI